MPGLPKSVVSPTAQPSMKRKGGVPEVSFPSATKRIKAPAGAPTKPVPVPTPPVSVGGPWAGSRRCASCLVRTTPQWRTFNDVPGVDGPVVLCNACGVRYVRSGHLQLAEVSAEDEENEYAENYMEETCVPLQELQQPIVEVSRPVYNFQDVPYCSNDIERSGSYVLNLYHREPWLALVDELTELCNEATRRHSLKRNVSAVGLSYDYIAQRADVDDPIRGVLVRTRAEGWLQGFAWYTTFTTWTNFFRWDSMATQCGMRRQDAVVGRQVDFDGSLARELEAQTRDGDPTTTGVVWPRVAEISLVGALGCGERLVELIIDELETETPYEYVVLQATKDSVGFYERLGFIRVGAVARYSHRRNGSASEIVGYRHWLGTEETIERTDRTSYMMARRLQTNRRHAHCVCGQPSLGLWQTEVHMVECRQCSTLFHTSCLAEYYSSGNQSATSPVGKTPKNGMWQCPKCLSNRKNAAAGGDEAAQGGVNGGQMGMSRTQMVGPDGQKMFITVGGGGPKVLKPRYGRNVGVDRQGRMEWSEVVKDRGNEQEGFLIMSRWGWVRHQPGCPCRCCKRQRIKAQTGV
mmetsp:Transcript_33744/g.40774  ORF Transcript_33744/g.40774 Transcript_33744/m.40774 type:complete len:578 (+) Transcript_33744:165-1898(+)|eukprot:CAMPEP_0197859234 /NCGR_PEP_ID=MMETSP1438-20131217/33665_1 /TAXON_ID=1461541 /ORGANISM="Pterosperma sp., Strain CCMP1384" /LENGTH=577 /DNA_ID=CAMNT_0043475665 /DNA_START=160 /DNA_END=1893 /DNA_ORIENTATION=+